MAVGTNSNSLRTPRKKSTLNTKENTRSKKNSKTNVSSKNFNKKNVKENVSSKQMVSKTKTESGMLKKKRSVEPKIDITRVTRFVDMSKIKPKPTRRPPVGSNCPSTTLSVKKAKAGTLLLDEEGKTPYNKFSACYDDLLQIPPTTCFCPFEQNDYHLLKKQFTPRKICIPCQQPRSNNFTIDIVTPPNSLTNSAYLKQAVTDHSTSISRNDTTCEVSSLSTDSTSSTRVTQRFVEEPKLRKSDYEDEKGEKYPIWKETTNLHYNNIKKDEQTDYLSTASSSINDGSSNSFVDEPKLGKFGYGDGNKKYQKVPKFHYNNIKEDKNAVSSDSTEGILEEISIDDCSARKKKSESVVNANIFNNKIKRAKISSRYKQHRQKLQMKPCLESVKEDSQLEQNLLEIGDGYHNVESQKLIKINSYYNMNHTKTYSYLESQKGADFVCYNTNHSAEVESPKSRSESRNTMAYSKEITKMDSTLSYPKNAGRTDSCIESRKGTNMETNNKRTECPDSLKMTDFVCNTIYYSAEGERPKSRSEKRKRISIETSNTMAYPKEITKTESCTEDQERMNNTNDTLAYPKNVERTVSYMESQKGTIFETMTNAKETRRSSGRQKRVNFVSNTMHYTAVGEGPKSTPDRQTRANVETSYVKEASKVESFSDSQEKYIEMNNTMTYPKGVRRVGSYLKSQKRRMIDTMLYPKGYYNTEKGRSKSYLESQNRTTVGTSNTMVYPKEFDRGELYSDCPERINSVYNNSGHNTTKVEKPKFRPDHQKWLDVETNNTMVYPKEASKGKSFPDLLQSLKSVYANITHCMTDFETAKSCLEYQKRTNSETNSTIASKGAERVEFFSEIQNGLNMIYGKIKYFTIELEEMKSCLECQKSLYIETSNTMARLKNASENENDKTIKYAEQVEIAETCSDIEATISFETDEIIKCYVDEVEQVESLSVIDLSGNTTETCSSEDVALVESCSGTTVSRDTSSFSKRPKHNMRHLMFLLKLHSTLSGFLTQWVECPL